MTSEEDLFLMGEIDRQCLETPFYGSRRVKAWLERRGMRVSRKRVQRLMRTIGLLGYFQLMEGVIRRYGLPLAIYGDRHGVFKFAGKPHHIQPPVEATHFSRAMQELGIEQVFARSTQAKGRVERMAGTLQDRLVSELRLAGATTINQANAVLQDFLPQFKNWLS